MSITKFSKNFAPLLSGFTTPNEFYMLTLYVNNWYEYETLMQM